MQSFQSYCESRNFNYLSVGHNYDGHFDAWVLKRRAKDIITASGLGQDPDMFHDDYQNGVDFKGRIDHDKKQISIVSEFGDQDRLNYVKSLLESLYPDYEIWLFGYGHPKKLT